MNSIKIFTFIKNEEDKIEDWILYHGYLFGYRNIYILDNESTDGTIEILKKYILKGINVKFNVRNYVHKHYHLSSLMLGFKNQGPRYLIPLDGDEFLALDRNGKIVVDREEIMQYLGTLPKDGRKYSFNRYLTGVPHKGIHNNPVDEIIRFRHEYIPNNHMKKFFLSTTFQGTDHGNHYGFVTHRNSEHIDTKLILFHYQNTGFRKYLDRAKNDAIGLGYNPNNIKLIRKLVEDEAIGHKKLQYILDHVDGKLERDTSWDVETDTLKNICHNLRKNIHFYKQNHGKSNSTNKNTPRNKFLIPVSLRGPLGRK